MWTIKGIIFILKIICRGKKEKKNLQILMTVIDWLRQPIVSPSCHWEPSGGWILGLATLSQCSHRQAQVKATANCTESLHSDEQWALLEYWCLTHIPVFQTVYRHHWDLQTQIDIEFTTALGSDVFYQPIDTRRSTTTSVWGFTTVFTTLTKRTLYLRLESNAWPQEGNLN